MAHRPADSALFEELAMPLFARLYNFACWLAQDRAAAEDLVQETYTKALKGFPAFEPETNFRAWMYRILRNTFLASQAGLKAMQLEMTDDQVGESETPGTPESILLARMEQEAIQRALEELPMHFREVILLCDYEEMSYQEISQTLLFRWAPSCRAFRVHGRRCAPCWPRPLRGPRNELRIIEGKTRSVRGSRRFAREPRGHRRASAFVPRLRSRSSSPNACQARYKACR